NSGGMPRQDATLWQFECRAGKEVLYGTTRASAANSSLECAGVRTSLTLHTCPRVQPANTLSIRWSLPSGRPAPPVQFEVPDQWMPDQWMPDQWMPDQWGPGQTWTSPPADLDWNALPFTARLTRESRTVRNTSGRETASFTCDLPREFLESLFTAATPYRGGAHWLENATRPSASRVRSSISRPWERLAFTSILFCAAMMWLDYRRRQRTSEKPLLPPALTKRRRKKRRGPQADMGPDAMRERMERCDRALIKVTKLLLQASRPGSDAHQSAKKRYRRLAAMLGGDRPGTNCGLPGAVHLSGDTARHALAHFSQLEPLRSNEGWSDPELVTLLRELGRTPAGKTLMLERIAMHIERYSARTILKHGAVDHQIPRSWRARNWMEDESMRVDRPNDEEETRLDDALQTPIQVLIRQLNKLRTTNRGTRRRCFYLMSGSRTHSVLFLFFFAFGNFFFAECNTGSGLERSSTVSLIEDERCRIQPNVYQVIGDLKPLLTSIVKSKLNPFYADFEGEDYWPGHFLRSCEPSVTCVNSYFANQRASAEMNNQIGGSCAIQSIVSALHMQWALGRVPLELPEYETPSF
ncbi:MAG: hypothetical protein AAF550_06035, partial [Myxococcota bacterium]